MPRRPELMGKTGPRKASDACRQMEPESPLSGLVASVPRPSDPFLLCVFRDHCQAQNGNRLRIQCWSRTMHTTSKIFTLALPRVLVEIITVTVMIDIDHFAIIFVYAI